jgi:hypothetical protein
MILSIKGEDFRSFFLGHAATAVAAEILALAIDKGSILSSLDIYGTQNDVF